MNAEVQTSVNTRESDLYWRGIVLSKFFIANLLSQVNIIDIIRDEFAGRTKEEGKLASLRKSPKGKDYVSLCPFHSEKGPSFHVESSMQKYCCFACGANGDAIKFLQEYKGMSFLEAVKYLAKKVGMKMKYGKIYKNDYLGKYDQYMRGAYDGSEGIRYSHNIEDIDAFKKNYMSSSVMLLKFAVSLILGEKDKQYGTLFGKSIIDILGYNPDTHPEVHELLGQVGEDDYEDEDSITEYNIEEDFMRQKPQETERNRIVALKADIRRRTYLLSEKNDIKKRIREEGEREKIFLDSQRENLEKLSMDLIRKEIEQSDFFRNSSYSLEIRGTNLTPGSMGKFICTYSQDGGFTCIFGEKRYLGEVPDSVEDLAEILSTKGMADAEIVHAGIPIRNKDILIGGAQFLVLSSDMICVSGKSTDFGSVPHSIVKRCLDAQGYTAVFLEDSPSITEAQAFNYIQIKLSEKGEK